MGLTWFASPVWHVGYKGVISNFIDTLQYRFNFSADRYWDLESKGMFLQCPVDLPERDHEGHWYIQQQRCSQKHMGAESRVQTLPVSWGGGGRRDADGLTSIYKQPFFCFLPAWHILLLQLCSSLLRFSYQNYFFFSVMPMQVFSLHVGESSKVHFQHWRLSLMLLWQLRIPTVSHAHRTPHGVESCWVDFKIYNRYLTAPKARHVHGDAYVFKADATLSGGGNCLSDGCNW